MGSFCSSPRLAEVRASLHIRRSSNYKAKVTGSAQLTCKAIPAKLSGITSVQFPHLYSWKTARRYDGEAASGRATPSPACLPPASSHSDVISQRRIANGPVQRKRRKKAEPLHGDSAFVDVGVVGRRSFQIRRAGMLEIRPDGASYHQASRRYPRRTILP